MAWVAPPSSTVPVSGYNISRSPSISATYGGNGVQHEQTYDYLVESADASGVESALSDIASVIVK